MLYVCLLKYSSDSGKELGESIFSLHSRRIHGVKSSGRAGKTQFLQEVKVSCSNLVCTPLFVWFSVCFSTPRLSEITWAGGREFLHKKETALDSKPERAGFNFLHRHSVCDLGPTTLKHFRMPYGCISNEKYKFHTTFTTHV